MISGTRWLRRAAVMTGDDNFRAHGVHMAGNPRREGFELNVGPGVVNGWRTKDFPSDKRAYELEVARTFLRALDDDLTARSTDSEPFDVEVISVSRNCVVAGVQLVEAYDDARRARDAARRQAIEKLCANQELAKLLDAWEIVIQTGTALAPKADANKVDVQLTNIRSLLAGVDWSRDEFVARDHSTVVCGRRRGVAGSLRYVWRGGLLPIPSKSPFLRAAESKVRKGYSRSKTTPFWLLVYSLSLTPTVSDRQDCGCLSIAGDVAFDSIFLFDVMGESIYLPLFECKLSERTVESKDGLEFQLDPSSAHDTAFPDDFIEVRLFAEHRGPDRADPE